MAKEKHKSKDKKRKRDRDDDEEHRKRRAEKLAKKVANHLQKHGAPVDEPDAPLGGRFVWTKKIEKDLASGVSVSEFSRKAEQQRKEDRLIEIEKVQKRRDEREAEKARMEEEVAYLNRERAVAEGIELEKKEELFHLEQAKMRSRQRLREGREQPSDVVAKDLHLAGEFDMEAQEPYAVFAGLTLGEMRELHEDILLWQDLDVHDPVHVEYWEAMVQVAEHELAEARRQEEIDRARVRGEAPAPHLLHREAGWHASIDQEVTVMLAGKTHRELLDLEDDITQQLNDGEAADPEYWTAVLRRLQIAKARSRLREIHAGLLQQQLAREMADVDVAKQLGWDRDGQSSDEEKEEADGKKRRGAEERNGDASPAAAAVEAVVEAVEEDLAEDLEHADPEALPETTAEAQLAAVAAIDDESESEEEEENTGQWSPAPLPTAMVVGQDVVSEEDDLRLLELLRQQAKLTQAKKYRAAAMPAVGSGDGDRAYRDMVSDPSGRGGVHPMMRHLTDAAPQEGERAFRSGLVLPTAETAAERGMRSAAEREMGDLNEAGDAPFGGEVAVDSQVYWWHEKYKPKKPKFYNRVHTGYEWNKYNQTHYDQDNPPPKVVQGYKFNIFYPDLLNPTEAPKYFFEDDPNGSRDTMILRFNAGPPYEDIAFRLIRKEVEFNHKRGFKDVFERGTMHLYFNFKRARYRR